MSSIAVFVLLKKKKVVLLNATQNLSIMAFKGEGWEEIKSWVAAG